MSQIKTLMRLENDIRELQKAASSNISSSVAFEAIILLSFGLPIEESLRWLLLYSKLII
jgi:hypothetical protein